MSIHRPKKKNVIKAQSGINMSQASHQSDKDQKIEKTLEDGAQSIPIIGAFAKIGNGLSEGVRGNETSGVRNTMGDMLGGANSVKAIASGRYKEAIPIYGGFAKAKRRREEIAKQRQKELEASVLALNQQSNSMFGQLTYKDGGQLKNNDHPTHGSEDKAIVLDGKSHKEGGNDVLDANTGEKIAETEVEELLFTSKQTQQMESYIDKYIATNDQECLLKLGTLVKNIIENETIDYSGKFK
jgi:hypothetical protein